MTRWLRIVPFAQALFLVLAAAVPTNAQTPVANSVADFSGVQGQNGWFYGFYDFGNDSDGAFDLTDFQLLDEYNASLQRWEHSDGPAPWTLHYATLSHPASYDSDLSPLEYWSVRRWVSDYTGAGTIDATVSKESFFGPVIAKIFVDGTEVFSQALSSGSTASFTMNTVFAVGTTLDLVLTPNGRDTDDATYFTATVTPEVVPEPVSIVLLGSGLIAVGALRRRRRQTT